MPTTRVVVVTGGTAGVGRATVRAVAARGFDVAVLARGQGGLDATTRDVEAMGEDAPLTIPTDVAEHSQVEAAAARIEDELGPIDIWVNNAMTTVFARLDDVTPEEFARATAVTYLGQVYGTMVALEHMKRRDRGRIVNVGSALAFVGIPLQAAYCGAKFASRGFTESVRAELLEEGSNVTVSLVHLPAVNTPQFSWCESKMPMEPMPVPPIYQPEVPARAIVAAALDGRRSKIVGSWNHALIAATQTMPAVVAHFAARTGVKSQQTDVPTRADRSSDLYAAVDETRDHGAHGIFGARAKGVRSPSFLKALPATVTTIGASMGAAVKEHLHTR